MTHSGEQLSSGVLVAIVLTGPVTRVSSIMRESLCHNAQWLRAMHITFVVAFAFLPLLSSLPSLHPFFLPLFLPVVVLNSDSSSFSCSSCSCGHTIPIRAGVLTSLCTAHLPLSRPRIKAPKSSPAAQHALIRRSLSISNIACVPHVHRTISRRVPLRTSSFSMAPCRYRPGTPVLFFFKSYSSRHSLPSVFLCNYCTTHARLITLRTFASLSLSLFVREILSQGLW